MYFFLVHPKEPQRSLFAGIFWFTLTGIFFGFYMLVIGYVSQDAKRRGMNQALWIIILICLIGSGVGFIIYFLLRDPIVNECPHCRERVEAGYNFCPSCRFELAPSCAQCKHTLHPEDVFCPFCGATQTSLSEVSATR